jgi:hypothetical protein
MLHYEVRHICGRLSTVSARLAANDTHADCLRIITRAEIRMANEVDAGQRRGEVARSDGSTNQWPQEGARASGTLSSTLADLGVSSQRLR